MPLPDTVGRDAVPTLPRWPFHGRNLTQLGSLDFLGKARNLMAVLVVRSRFFSCLALLLWATVGLLADGHCACEDEVAACEHAGQVCAQPDDCSDCLAPADVQALEMAPLAVLPSAPLVIGVDRLSVPLTFVGCLVASPAPESLGPDRSTYRPPALRAGTMSLRL